MKSITTLSARAEAIGPLKIASRPEALQYTKVHFLHLFIQNLEKKQVILATLHHNVISLLSGRKDARHKRKQQTK